jgi:hypothetical protein
MTNLPSLALINLKLTESPTFISFSNSAFSVAKKHLDRPPVQTFYRTMSKFYSLQRFIINQHFSLPMPKLLGNSGFQHYQVAWVYMRISRRYLGHLT